MSSLEEINKLGERYPFTEEELEVLLRCQRSLMDESNEDSFLMKLAMCSPYSFFFLPGDELRNRVTFAEDYILPMGFPNELRSSIAADAFVNYANAEHDLPLERFLEGIADTGRRGPKEALRVIYGLVDQPTPEELMDMCLRMSIAAETIVAPAIHKEAILARVDKAQATVAPLVESLKEACGGKELTKKLFMDWAEAKVPMLSTTLTTFVHNLLFHGHPQPAPRIPYQRPLLDHASDVFADTNSALLYPLSLTSAHCGGKMHRLYSSEMDGRSFNRLEWSILGYAGPTLVVVRTEENATLGAFASMPWKDSKDFYGDSDCFLFQLEPIFHVRRPSGRENHFLYCHSQIRNGKQKMDARPHGLGFGGTNAKPRLFIPESLDNCSADFLDSTYEPGDLLPQDALEKFRIKFLEVWGVGGDEVIQKAMRARAEYREATNTTILKARTVMDKSQFAADLQSGLIPNKLYEHQEQARGRQEFRVDDEHGGYKVDRD